ncbi:hypothetical protein V1509DRAFT_461475 [Lipomyces kononenkoae]
MARTRPQPWRHGRKTIVTALTLLSSTPTLSSASTNSFQLSNNFYFQAYDNSFYKAVVSATVYPSNSTLSTNINNGSILRLSTPPSNASIALGHDNIIYAFYGICGSAIQVATFDDNSNTWTDLVITDAPSYRAGSILFMDTSSTSLIYIFGGYCSGSTADSIVYYNTLSAFDVDTHTFTQPSNSNPPVALGDASAITTPLATILLGGIAAGGWIGMNQLAIWEAASWSYRTVQNSTSVDSRTDPIVVLNEAGTKVVISGGYVEGREASPTLSVLELSDSNGAWFWDTPNLENFPPLQAAVMLPGDVMLGITGGADQETLLLNTSSWTYLSTYTQSAMTAATSTAKPASISRDQLSSGSLAAISTSTVIAVIVLLVTIIALVYKRRRRARPLGPLTPQSDQGFFLSPTRHIAKPLENDRASDVGSVATWTEQRKSWIKKYSDIFGGPNNNGGNNDEKSSPASALSSGPTFSENCDPARNSSSTLFAIGRSSLRGFQSLRTSAKWTTTDVSKLTGDRRSTGNRRSGLQGFRRRSSGGHSLGLGLMTANGGEELSKTGVENDDDIYELFKDREVQVLVSTTRRGKLRITNPDDDADESDPTNALDEKSDSPLTRLSSTSSKTRWLVGNEQQN